MSWYLPKNQSDPLLCDGGGGCRWVGKSFSRVRLQRGDTFPHPRTWALPCRSYFTQSLHRPSLHLAAFLFSCFRLQDMQPFTQVHQRTGSQLRLVRKPPQGIRKLLKRQRHLPPGLCDAGTDKKTSPTHFLLPANAWMCWQTQHIVRRTQPCRRRYRFTPTRKHP